MLCENKIYVCDEYSCEGPYDFETKTFNGFCKIKYKNGDSYEGFMKKDKFNGTGIYKTKDYEYNGNWEDSKKSGTGIIKYKKGDSYVGDFINNLKHGKGKSTSNNTLSALETEHSNEIYNGEWKYDTKDGNGILTKTLKFINGNMYHCEYIGTWNDDILNDCIIKQYDINNKTKLIFTYIGKVNKYGLAEDICGKTICEKFSRQGEYKNGFVSGKFIDIYNDDSDTIFAKIEYDEVEKKGKVYYKNGMIFEGYFNFSQNRISEKINGITKYKIDDVEYSFTTKHNETIDGKMINIKYEYRQTTICDGNSRNMTFINSEWKDGKIIYGLCNYGSGNTYEGEFLLYHVELTGGNLYLKHGNGKLCIGDTTFYGIFGYEVIRSGICIYPNGDIYCGEFYWIDGVTKHLSYSEKCDLKKYRYCKHGNGKMKYNDGTVYEGKWDKDLPFGKSRIQKNGDVYKDYSIFGISILSKVYNLEEKMHDFVFGKSDEIGTKETLIKKQV